MSNSMVFLFIFSHLQVLKTDRKCIMPLCFSCFHVAGQGVVSIIGNGESFGLKAHVTIRLLCLFSDASIYKPQTRAE